MKGYKRFDQSKVTESMKQLLKDCVSNDPRIAEAARYKFAAEIVLPALRSGIMSGDIVTDIFDTVPFNPGEPTMFPLDFLAPGTERDFTAYTVPNQGRIPNKFVEGDYVMIPTFQSANAIDVNRRYLQFARWDVMSRMLEVLEAGMIKKRNDDGWHLLLTGGLDRNIVVYDSEASQGQFTKRLVSLMKLIMRRNGGGNSTSVNRFQLTDLYMSPESQEDIRNWGLDQIDEVTRREIYLAPDNSISRVFGVNLHAIDELGEDQEYQLFFQNDLGGALQTSDVELFVGLDLVTTPAFKMPVVEDINSFPDESAFRSRQVGWVSMAEWGFGLMDNRPVLLGSC